MVTNYIGFVVCGIYVIGLSSTPTECCFHFTLGEAENIINYESELLELPCNLPSLSTIDQARQIRNDQLKMHSTHQPLYY